jgi:putative transport protein
MRFNIDNMIQAFIENPILLLFVVAGIGYGLGSIKIKGTGVGVAAVLFVGLLFGGLSPELRIEESIIFLGLAIFVYSIGLTSGPSFFQSFKQKGLRDILFVVVMIALSAAIALGLHFLLNFSATTTSGIFAGSTTNTPALAGLLDVIRSLGLKNEQLVEMSEQAVVGYSLTYPMGLIGAIIAIQVVSKMLKIDLKKEEIDLKDTYPVRQEIVKKTLEITNPEFTDISIRDLKRKYDWQVVFGRLQRNDTFQLTNWDSTFKMNDRIVVVGDKEDLEKVIASLGKELPYDMPEHQSEYITKRIFVSNPNIVGERLSTLNLPEKFSAIVATIRRGDIDLLADGDTVLELGDQVLFVARRREVSKISKFFGDSFEALSKINLLSFGLGMAIGLLLGMVSIQLPGGGTFKLGFAGGIIVVALILGALRRTGPILWTLPFSANLTLRQIGLILLLAGIGVNSGHTFISTISQGGGGWIVLAGSIISFLTVSITLVVGYKLLKIPFCILLGMVSTQPAILDFVLEKADNKLPILGYTLILPVSLIFKVLFVQILFGILN